MPVLKDRTNKGIEMRQVVTDTLNNLMETNKQLIAIEADLGGASGWVKIQKEHPKQFINAGIAEANMVGVAAGLSQTGYTPFIHTFGPFASRRCFDQLFLSGGYAGNTINIFGSDPGFTAGMNGGTHTTWEDVALIKMIPHSIICDAADEVQMRWIIEKFSTLEGIHYVRGNRKDVRNVYEEGTTFELGKGNVVKDGSDYVIIAAGQLLSEALDVADELQADGISIEVIDMFTIKPLDKSLILKSIQGKKGIITIENHSVVNGLGSSVAEVLAESGTGIKLHRIGVEEQFGQVGTPDYLQAEFKLDDKSIKEKIINFISK